MSCASVPQLLPLDKNTMAIEFRVDKTPDLQASIAAYCPPGYEFSDMQVIIHDDNKDGLPSMWRWYAVRYVRINS